MIDVKRMPERTVSAPSLVVGGVVHEKPPYSFPCLIGLALRASESGSLCVRDIYAYIVKHFPYYVTAKSGWKNSIRHNLSLNKYFTKLERRDGPAAAKCSLWTIAPQMHDQLDRDIRTCLSRFPARMRRPREHEVGGASPLRKAASQPAMLVPRGPTVANVVPTISLCPPAPAPAPMSYSSVCSDMARPPSALSSGVASTFSSSASLNISRVARRLSMDEFDCPAPSAASLLGDPCLQSIDELLLSSCSSGDPGLFDGLLEGLWAS